MPSTLPSAGSLAPIFIVGAPRSGTTLLQRLLDAHPRVAIAPETHFMRRFWRRQDAYGDLREDAAFARLIEDVVAIDEFPETRIDPVAFREAASEIDRTLPAVFALLLRSFADRRGAAVIGEKTPDHVHYMRELEEFFPGARFIQIIRDPRAVLASWKHVPWSKGSVERDARAWRRAIRAGRERPPRDAAMHTVRYEALVTEPESALRAICAFLQIDYEPGMLAFHERPPETLNLTREPWKKGAAAGIYNKAVDSWRRTLSAREIAAIERLLWPEMRRLGYPTDASVARLAAGWIRAAIAIRVARVAGLGTDTR